MSNFAVIETGGKQYKVSVGQKIKVERLKANEGEGFVFDKVLLRTNEDKIEIGAPYLANAKVEAKVLKQGREKKKIVFKYHPKTRYRRRKGHRQHFTEVEIKSI